MKLNMNKHRNFNRLFMVTLLILCGSLLLLTNACGNLTKTKNAVSSNPEVRQVIQNYLEAVRQNNLDKAKSFLTNCAGVPCFPEPPMYSTQVLIERDRWELKEIKNEIL